MKPISSATVSGNGWAVPQESALRESVRAAAESAVAGLCRGLRPDRKRLEALSRGVLGRLGLDGQYLGFAMVTVGTALLRDEFGAVPYRRRLLLLPHCLRNRRACRGHYDRERFICGACGSCDIGRLQGEARHLGYKVLVAEGTPGVVETLARERIGAILGVACLDSLEKCFGAVSQLGVPYAGVPLLRNGCAETAVEAELVRDLLRVRSPRLARSSGVVSPGSAARTKAGLAGGPSAAAGQLALLAAAMRLFEQKELRQLLGPHLSRSAGSRGNGHGSVARVEQIALDWLLAAGKRLRPFITLASYAALRQAQDPQQRRGTLGPARAGRRRPPPLPRAVKAVAVAMELFHKASLVHDDVEDNDGYRYGRPTIHAVHGVPTAVNTGDYLLGLGYRLVAGQGRRLGGACAAEILSALSEAHVRLCRGQGAELLMSSAGGRPAGPDAQTCLAGRRAASRAGAAEVLEVYALKTAPAFYVSMVAGLRMAGPLKADTAALGAFFRHLGVAYQVLDDLADLDDRGDGREGLGQDVLGRRPTILRAFAEEAGAGPELSRLVAQAAKLGRAETVARVRALYESCGAIEKARRLVDKCRARAAETADQARPAALRDLMNCLLAMVLDGR
jgi:geranylgeranyl pyrophosphate synthase